MRSGNGENGSAFPSGPRQESWRRRFLLLLYVVAATLGSLTVSTLAQARCAEPQDQCPCSSETFLPAAVEATVVSMEPLQSGQLQVSLEINEVLRELYSLTEADTIGGRWSASLPCGGEVDVQMGDVVLAFFKKGDKGRIVVVVGLWGGRVAWDGDVWQVSEV